MRYVRFIAVLIFYGVANYSLAEEEPSTAQADRSTATSKRSPARVGQAEGDDVRQVLGSPSGLYNASTFQSLTGDRRHFRVGDMVTVQIAEVSSASTSAGTGAQRDSNLGVSAYTTHLNKRLGIATNNDFSGQGSTQRAGRVLGQLTVTVQGISQNQDLLIAGEQWLEINGEKQMIRLEGRIRARDVNELNTVISSRVADARISIVGDGAIADRQKPSWWQQILTFFGA